VLDDQAAGDLRQGGRLGREERGLKPARGALSEREIIARYEHAGLAEEERVYLRRHAPRYAYLLALIDELRAELGSGADGEGMRVLDVGPSFQTQMLRDLYPRFTVSTLGLEPSAVSRARPGESHITYDLNDVLDPASWPAVEPQPLVVMAEVIEHLYTPPVPVLRCAASWLEPRGLLVLQTPNAAALFNRLRLLAGRNPFQHIRENRRNPGHFREYTLAELTRFCRRAGLDIVRVGHENYLEGDSWRSRFEKRTRRTLPPSLRRGITLVLRRP
jgi:2-polyprenyl-3-methyl-5-hydroxy-6-metoxy-1,4-benzoquinol methylase